MTQFMLNFAKRPTQKNEFSCFYNNMILRANTREIVGGEDELPLPEEDDFIIIEDFVDL